jgi:predicted nucleotide-binding protein (sugar kinase/HSP70/actin superfamily)
MNFLLGELGQGRLRVVSPKFDFTARLLGMDGLKWLWRGLVAVDLLVKEACRLRAYETQAGLTDRLHWDNLKDLEAGLTRRDLDPSLSRMAARLRSVEVRDERRPLVGVAGDIYTRTNGFANHDLFHRLEAMGCEVWPAPFFVDEAEFTTQESLVRAWRGVRIPELAAAAVLNLRKDLERARVRRVLDWGEDRWAEPGYRDVLSKSAPYLSQHSNPLVLLNVAKMVDFARRGADGVLNVICFNCMLGTVSGALAERIRRDCGNIPLPTLVYSGTDSVSEQTRLEAFVYQAKRFAERRGSRTAPEQARPSSGGAGPGRLWVARGRGAPGSREGD